MFETCGCPASTRYCAKHQITISMRQHDFLRGTSGLPREKEQVYVAKLLRKAAGEDAAPAREEADAPKPARTPPPTRRAPKPAATPTPNVGLGDWVEKALTSVGITKERVTDWLGRPCNCKERKERLNQLGSWAARVLAGKVEAARDYLDRMLAEEPPKES